jgi:HAD superfamily hydrolase (TIGR01509 family)
MLKGRTFPEAQMLEMMERKNGYYLDYLTQLTPADALPGVVEFLAAAHAEGILIGLGSASKNATLVLKGLGLTERFQAIGDGYSVVNAKPAPDLFLWVAGRLGLPPQECIVFEDAEAGVEAALKGGFWCVGLGPHERVGQAHLRYDSLAEIALGELHLPLGG